MFDPYVSSYIPKIGDVLDFGDYQQTVLNDIFLHTTSQRLFEVVDQNDNKTHMMRRQFSDGTVHWSE
jgi:hypothetical protein